MTYNCCIFNVQGIAYLSQCEKCEKCKKQKKLTNIINQTNQFSVKYKFKWYEFHIQLIRD